MPSPRALAALVLAGGLLLSAASTAAAAQMRVTFAARVCDSYSQIYANEARNNIMESLKQLGPNTPYPSSTSHMDPVTENQPPQDACRPLVGWRFTMGTAIAPTKLTGVWGSLSQVANPYDTEIVTREKTPLRDESGIPGNGDFIYGAVTIELNDDQEQQAARSSLWVMGGTSAAPVGDATKYAFGALRCAVDNLNGDNVEFVSYPAQVDHVYCFAYYVSPPKGSGTIIVRKHVAGAPAGTPAQTFQFRGNVSFDNSDPVNHPDDGRFALTASPSNDAEAAFVREAGSLWNFRELAPGGQIASITVSCTSANRTSTITNPDPNPARPHGVEVALADGDTVTCTYTNTHRPPPVGLTVQKITRGGVGTFPMSVSGLGSFELTTTQPGTPAEKTLSAEPGSTHTITETLPESDTGTWTAESITCKGVRQRLLRSGARSTASATVTLPQTGGTVCTFVNRFIPAGRITVRKITRGGTATATFYVEPQPQVEPPKRFVQRATTTAPDTPATALPVDPADSTVRIPLGTYTIQELAPFVDNGTWNLVAVLCDGVEPEPAAAGAIRVELTGADPEVECTFTDRLAAEPEPLPPLPPEGPVPPAITELPPPGIQVSGTVAQSAAKADLVVRKVAAPRTVVVGHEIHYLVTIRNRGPGSAQNVGLVEPIARTARVLRLQPSKGRCRGVVPRICALGTLRPGESATVRVTVTPRRAGRFVNLVAAVTSSEVRTLRTMLAVARVRVLRAAGARFTG